MVIAALPFLRALPWRWIGAAVAVAGALWWHDGKVDAKVEAATIAERMTWQAARNELLQLRRQRHDDAAAKAESAFAALPARIEKGQNRVEIHWRDRPVRDCLDADSVRATEESRAILRRATAASEGNSDM